jgi:cobalt-zinc-cadmium efflux system membrane fusion protein
MKLNIIIIIIALTAAVFGWRYIDGLSTARATGDHDILVAENAPSDVHDVDGHEIHENHADHGEEMHEAHGDADEDLYAGHDHGAEIVDHDAHEDADTHDSHQGHDHDAPGHPEKGLIPLMSATQATETGITIDTIKTGSISRRINLTGEVLFNRDRTVHLVPRISGVVDSVHKKLGDLVKKGEVLAVIHSRELTDIKSDYLSARERIENAKINFDRETSLWEKKIIPERQYLESKQQYIDSRIALRSARLKLHALGFSEQYITDLPNQSHDVLFQYHLAAPTDGAIIEKHIVQGESATTESPAFVIADTSSLWIDLRAYPKDLPSLRIGQNVFISAQDGSLTAEGTLSYLSPVISPETRTALARVELSDKDHLWRAGLFVNAVIMSEQNHVDDLLIAVKSAVQTIEGKPTVFIKTDEGYVPTVVETGRSDHSHVEILSGVSAGQEYVAGGSFELKAKLVTSRLDGHAGHGH